MPKTLQELIEVYKGTHAKDVVEALKKRGVKCTEWDVYMARRARIIRINRAKRKAKAKR